MSRSVALVPEDLESTLQELGMTLGRSTDTEVWTLCPAHERRTGSPDSKPTNYSINRVTGDSFCFSCGYRGRLVEVVAEVLDCNAWEASRWLRNHGASLLDVVQRIERKVARQKVAIGKMNQRETYKVDPDVEFATFDDVPSEHLYLRSLSRESADLYRVRWRDGWVVPVADPDGRVRGWQYKKDRVFLNHPKTLRKSNHLFGLDVFSGRRAILVESPLDAVRLHTAGYAGGLSSFGVEVSPRQMGLLLETTDHLVLALDNDGPGRKQTRTLIEGYLGRLRIHVFDYGSSRAKDPGEMTDEEIQRGMDNAQPAALWR